MTLDPKSNTSTEPTPAASRVRRVRLAATVGVIAAIGGIGLASLGEKPAPAVVGQSAHSTALIRGISGKAVELTFNPRSSRGLKVAKAAFRIRYCCQVDKREAVRDRLDTQWNVLVTASLRVLMRHTAPELKSDEGLDKILEELARAIDESVFGDGIAKVEAVLPQQIIVQ